MSKIDTFKHNLACVFDDNPKTRVWQNIVDWVIIALIIISTVTVFLSTFSGINEQIGGILSFLDVFTTIVFTIEVSLRIWTADLLDEKYKGFWGRVRYCFSFYGLIDFISTYTFYLGLIVNIPVAALKVFRVARLFRIFRYMKSFRILGEAIKSKRQELSISFAFLSILTIILSFLLYFAEHDAQPELYENGWNTLVWAFAKYLGDPGKIADFPIVTVWGNIIAIIVGLLGIAIFAVPAGLIGSGFIEVIEERKHKEEVERNIERVRHSLRWEKDMQHTNLYYVPPFKPIDSLLVKQFLPANEVVEAVEKSNNLHLYNLAKAFSSEDEPVDRIVVASGLRNRPYGCCIDRGSKVTIVSTSTYDEPITGWVAYHIAKIGGFNYVSKEVDTNPDTPVSYYNITDPNESPNMQAYLADINRLSIKPGAWVIPMCFCVGPKTREHTVHLCYSQKKHDHGYDHESCTFNDSETFDSFAHDLEMTLQDIYGLKTDKNDYYIVNAKDNLLHYLTCKNGFVIRMECRIIYFPADKISKIKAIADVLNRHFEPGIDKPIPQEMLARPANCFGYEGYID